MSLSSMGLWEVPHRIKCHADRQAGPPGRRLPSQKFETAQTVELSLPGAADEEKAAPSHVLQLFTEVQELSKGPMRIAVVLILAREMRTHVVILAEF